MIITLCGSARFERHYHAWNKVLSLSGHVVFGLAAYPSIEGDKDWYSESDKAMLDAVHLNKIEASDAILVLNRFAYIGESTMREIKFAMTNGKKVYFIESWGRGLGINCGVRHNDTVTELCKKHGLGENTRSPLNTTTGFVRRDPVFNDAYRVNNVYDELLPMTGQLRSDLVIMIAEADRD